MNALEKAPEGAPDTLWDQVIIEGAPVGLSGRTTRTWKVSEGPSAAAVAMNVTAMVSAAETRAEQTPMAVVAVGLLTKTMSPVLTPVKVKVC